MANSNAGLTRCLWLGIVSQIAAPRFRERPGRKCVMNRGNSVAFLEGASPQAVGFRPLGLSPSDAANFASQNPRTRVATKRGATVAGSDLVGRRSLHPDLETAPLFLRRSGHRRRTSSANHT